MIAIGNVKWGKRIEPIYIQELSREEVSSILQSQGIQLAENLEDSIDTRIVNIFRTDEQKLSEYIKLCKYWSNKKAGIDTEKPDADGLSILSSELQINYELRHLKESQTMAEEEKIKIYKRAKETQNLFKMFGANNIKLEINLFDRAYFEIQNLIHTIKNRGKVQALPEGKSQNAKPKREFRRELFDQEAQVATEKISETWQEPPKESIQKEEFTKN